MPIYEYRCVNGHAFEVFQGMSDDPVEACEECGEAVERVFHPVAVHFKGSGFYTTDYAGRGKPDGSDGDSSASEAGSGGGEKSEAKDSKPDAKAPKKDSKTAAKD